MRFLTEEEVRDWDAVAAHCDEIEGLDNNQRQRAKDAFVFLSNEFGGDFLRAPSFNLRHPFYLQILIQAAHTRIWFIQLVEAMQEVKHNQNYGSLLKRLRDHEKFAEAESVLETAYKFFRSGFQLEFDPEVKVDGKTKMPDLKLTNEETSTNGNLLYK